MPEALGTVVRGMYGTSDIFTEQRKYDKDKSKQFIWRERGYASLAHALVTMLPKVAVSDPEPKHFEDGYRIFKVALTGLTIAAPSGSAPELVTITFSTSSSSAQFVGLFVVGQKWENELIFMSNTLNPTFNLTRSATYGKREIMQVTSVNVGTGDVIFRRHIGTDTRLGTTVAPATTHTLHLHNIASAEGSGSPIPSAQNPVVVNNFIEIFKEPYEQTEVAMKTDIFGENEWQRKARNARRNFARQIDRAFIGGHQYKIAVDATTGKPLWFTGGAEEWVPEDTEHRIDVAKPPTATHMNTLLKNVFMYGSSEKWFLLGYGAVTKISNAMVDHIRMNNGLSDLLALDVFDIQTAGGGMVHMLPSYEMSVTGKDDEGLVLDLQYLKYMYLQGSDIAVDKGPGGKGLQSNDAKTTIHQIYGTVGLRRTFRDSHFQLYNFQ